MLRRFKRCRPYNKHALRCVDANLVVVENASTALGHRAG